MGQDKGLMILEENPLIIHILKTLEELVDEIILVLRDKTQLNSYERLINDHRHCLKDSDSQIKLVTDLEMDKGPLVGLITGLSHVKAKGALVLPCDSPYLSHDFINNVFEMVFELNNSNMENEFMAIVPKWPDGSVEPLHAYYFKECIPAIKSILHNGLRDVKSLHQKINVDYVDVEVLDPEKSSFKNLNSPEDLYSFSKEY